MDIESARNELLALRPFLSAEMLITIAVIPMAQKALMVYIAHSHAKRRPIAFRPRQMLQWSLEYL